MKIEKDSAQVRVPPPLGLLAALLLGWGLQRLLPLSFGVPAFRIVGEMLAASAVVVVISCNRLFKKAGTNVAPWKPSSSIVEQGPYALSRNPIYSSMLAFCAGLGMALDMPWMLGMALPLMLWLRYAVIAREEAYLEAKFGADYVNYKKRVRRWL